MARLPDPATSRAVLIGTSRYTDPELADLPQVEANLRDLRDVLTSPHGASLPDGHCLQVLDPPGPREIYSVLTAAAAEAEDTLLVYYAGHGLTWTDRNELCLALPGTAAEQAGPTALRCADVRQVLLRTRARIRVLILDCCFSGRAFEQTLTRPADALLSEADVEGAFVLTATEPNQLADAPSGERNTLFTGRLLRLLRDGVPDGPELLTLGFLFGRLRAMMKAANQPRPTCNNHNSAAHLALARNRGIRPDDLIDKLRASIGDVRIAESGAVRVHDMALEKILEPGLLPPPGAATHLDRRMDDVQARADRLGWTTTLVGELKTLLDDCAAALIAAQQHRERAQGRLDLREQLRGQLEMFRAMAERKRIAEAPEIRRWSGLAHRLLWTKPCDLHAAQRALDRYARLVIEWKENT